MTVTVTITWDDVQFQTGFRNLADMGRDTSPLMAGIAEGLLHSTQDRFDTKLSPDGVPWAPLRPSTQATKQGPSLLIERGLLSGGLFPNWGSDFAEIAAPAFYARWHQEGTQPYTIRPSSKQALKIPGVGVRKSANHPGLPARPFMGLSTDDAQMVLDSVAAAMRQAFN